MKTKVIQFGYGCIYTWWMAWALILLLVSLPFTGTGLLAELLGNVAKRRAMRVIPFISPKVREAMQRSQRERKNKKMLDDMRAAHPPEQWKKYASGGYYPGRKN